MRAIGQMDVDIRIAELTESFGGCLNKLRKPFDRVDLSGKQRQDSSAVARASPHFKHFVIGVGQHQAVCNALRYAFVCKEMLPK